MCINPISCDLVKVIYESSACFVDILWFTKQACRLRIGRVTFSFWTWRLSFLFLTLLHRLQLLVQSCARTYNVNSRFSASAFSQMRKSPSILYLPELLKREWLLTLVSAFSYSSPPPPPPPLSSGDTSQDPQWVPETLNRTEPCIDYVFSQHIHAYDKV